MAVRKKSLLIPLKTYVFILFLLASVVPLLIYSIINYNGSKTATMDAVLSSRDQFFNLASLEINTVIEQVEKVSMQLSVDKSLLEEMKKEPENDLEELQRMHRLSKNVLNPYLALYPYIENIIIYPKASKHAILSGNSGFSITDNYEEFGDYQSVLNYPRVSYWQGQHVYDGSYYGYTVENIISFFQKNVISDEPAFVIEVQIKPSVFEEKIQVGADIYESKIVLLGEDSQVVATNSNVRTDQILQILKEKQEEYCIKTIQMKNGWQFLYLIPYKAVEQHARLQLLMTMGTMAVYILLAAFLAAVISMLVSWPVKQMVANMEVPLEDEQTVYECNSHIKEMGFLAEAYSSMRKRIKCLIVDLLAEQQEKQKMETIILQSQINPHFLYNSLNLIRCSAVLNRQKDIEKMTVAIIQLLEFSINHQECVTVSEEISITNQYIALQECRHNKKMNVQIQAEDALYQKLVLKMLLIPLVENAIIHAYNGGEGNIRIDVSISNIKNRLVIKVQDYGSGMTAERIKEIMEQSDSRRKFNRIGLKNIEERIQLYFGRNYGMTIESKEGTGTIVRIEQPVLSQEDWEGFRIKYYEKNCNCR